MPKKPPTLCRPPCPGLWNGERCTVCDRKPSQTGWADDKQRGTRQARGYDNDWLKLRARKLRDKPLCEVCEEAGKIVVATQVHHVKPFRGLRDPLRLDMRNLQSVCDACHGRLTSSQSFRRNRTG